MVFALVAAALLSTGLSTCKTSGDWIPGQVCETDDSTLVQLQRREDLRHGTFHAMAAKAVRAGANPLMLSNFHNKNPNDGECYDREANNNWAVVDAHLHARPFGGKPVPFSDLIDRLRRSGILFTTLYGIGQRLPIDSTCTYYLDCPGTSVTPSLKNDFFNAQSVLDNAEDLADPSGPKITLSMSFFDLHDVPSNLNKMKLLQDEFPGMFKWVGEINLVKQALWPNHEGLPIPRASIKDWKPFMDEFRRQDIPMALHCDLGNNQNGTQFLALMDGVLRTYPENKIIWVHMAGISKQLNPHLQNETGTSFLEKLHKPITIESHVRMIEERLKNYSKLMIDLSWDILYDELYTLPAEKAMYVNLINQYPDRFLSGSDHVASIEKTEDKYRKEVNKTSAIYKDLNDVAFRNIALGQNYFKTIGLNFTAPKICPPATAPAPTAMLQQESLQAANHDDDMMPEATISETVVLPSMQTLPAVSDFREGSTTCFDRNATDQWAVVDAHLHARPFGGPPVPFNELMDRLRRAGILFTTLYGIGQRLPISSNCTYYLDCPGTIIKPSLKNDFFNAQSVLDNEEEGSSPIITLAMSFFDLDNPETILPKMKLLQSEFPNMFRWAGEINVVKQALWKNNAGKPIPIASIQRWAPFMAELSTQDIPLALHCDLGNDENGTKFLPLMDAILEAYPQNKIIWVHMAGISKQLDPKLAMLQVPVSIQQHVKIIKNRFEKYPHLFVDLSWDILYDSIYHDTEEEKPYIELINQYPARFLSGSDHVAAAAKTEAGYRKELAKVNAIYKELSDEAFQNIALGGNYFKLAHLKEYRPPPICAIRLTGGKLRRMRTRRVLMALTLAVVGTGLVFLLVMLLR